MVKKLSDLNSSLEYVVNPLTPISAGMQFHIAPGQAIPTGCLEADGSAVSRTTYADLFANIGTAYGIGDGSTTFNLPNGPRRSVDIPLTMVDTPAGYGSSYEVGYVEQDTNGNWFLHFMINSSATSFTSISTMYIDGIVVDQQQVLYCGSATSPITGRAFYFASNKIFLQWASSNAAVYLGGKVRLAGKPTDAFVAASTYSTFDEALEGIPVITAYNNQTTGTSVAINPATASNQGVVSLSSSFAAGDGVYGFVQANKWQVKVLTADVSTNGTMADLTFNNLVVGNIYRVTIHPLFYIQTGTDAYVTIKHDGNILNRTRLFDSDTSSETLTISDNDAIFKATTTTVIFESTATAGAIIGGNSSCLLYTSPSPRDGLLSRMPSSA